MCESLCLSSEFVVRNRTTKSLIDKTTLAQNNLRKIMLAASVPLGYAFVSRTALPGEESMQITITVETGSQRGRVFTFAAHDTFLVGRSKHAHFQLPPADLYCLCIHFMVEVNPPHCRLLDLGSNNGTHVNDCRVTTAELKDGDRIRAGRTLLRVSVLDNEPLPTLCQARPRPSISPHLPEPPPAGLGDRIRRRGRPAPSGLRSALSAPSEAVALCPACREQAGAHPQRIPGYTLVRELGRGGMGVVYLALRLHDREAVALKKTTPAVAATRAQIERFCARRRSRRQSASSAHRDVPRSG